MQPDAKPAFDFATLTPTEGVRQPTPHDRAADWPARRYGLGAVLFALLLHGYALTVLPAVMDLDLPEEEIVDLAITNDDIAFDPDLPLNYNIDRIEEVSVPGPVGVDAPATVPPPPGFGAGGQGGGIDPPERAWVQGRTGRSAACRLFGE